MPSFFNFLGDFFKDVMIHVKFNFSVFSDVSRLVIYFHQFLLYQYVLLTIPYFSDDYDGKMFYSKIEKERKKERKHFC